MVETVVVVTDRRRAKQRECMKRLRASRTPQAIAKQAAELEREAMLAYAYESDMRHGARVMYAGACQVKATEVDV